MPVEASMLPTVSDIQPVAVACDLSSAKSSAGRFIPVAVVVTFAAVVVVSAGIVFAACSDSCEPSSAISLADLLRETLGATAAPELGGGTRLARLGSVHDDAAAVEDDAAADSFGAGSAHTGASSI